jgi:SNW domain-containing protein 1
MTSISTSLSKSLPKPKYTGEDEQLPTNTTRLGPRVVDASSVDSQVALRSRGPPPYGQRLGWRPREQEDFGDGGAFPEINVAQYPLDMGRKGTASTSNALVRQVDTEGNTKYDAIARRGHSDTRIIQSSFKDLIPLRQRADAGELSLAKPSAEEAEETRRRTQQALMGLVDGATKAQNPKLVKANKKQEPTYVRYTPNAGQMGDYSEKKEKIFKIVARQVDPMAPPLHKHKKIPGRAPSPPPPVMHSPPRKVTAEQQEMWRIPSSISNWKNPKGYTIALDKRLASNGRGLEDVTINDKFSQLSESLYMADRHAREEVQQRALMQQKLAEKEQALKEDNLRQLAQKARQDRAAITGSRRRSRSGSRSEDSYGGSDSEAYDSEKEDGARERERDRKERARERQRELRMSKMGTEGRMRALARESGRDISEKVALGLAKPTATAESMYDSRLFNQSSGLAAGFNEDQHYDKPLFAAQEALNSIYRPKMQEEDDGEGADETLEKIKKSKRFDGFKDAKYAEEREGPVLFEKDKVIKGSVPGKGDDDPFGIDDMIKDVTGGKGKKRFGMQEGDDDRSGKRARVDSDEE